MALFWATIRRNSVSLLRLSFLNHVQVFSSEISLVCLIKCSCNSFSSQFCFRIIIFLLILILFVFLVTVISLSLLFSYVVFESTSMYRSYFKCWLVFFLFLFLTHRVCPCYLWDVKPYASSWVFLFSGPFVEVFPSSSIRIVPSILHRGQPMCLLFWWDFCYIV